MTYYVCMPENNYHHGDLKNALIKAGVEILAKEGAGGLSLRKVARRVGVSHSAPYAHFHNKQALIAAISTEGFKQLYTALDAAISSHAGEPKRQLQAGVWAYAQFAIQNTDTFKIMFSGLLEKEREYPDFVEISHRTFERVAGVVRACQIAGILRRGPAEVMAVSVWGQVHGIISLMLAGQISHAVLDNFDISEVVSFALDQILIA